MAANGILKRYSGFILIAPAIVPLLLAEDNLAFSIPGLNHFLTQPVRQCAMIGDYGHLVLQDNPLTKYLHSTYGIPCVYDRPYSVFLPVSFVQQFYAWRFIQATLFTFAGGIIIFIFFRKRRALAARGILPGRSLYSS